MKEIYRFTINKKETVDEVEKSTNEKGEEISINRKVEREVPHTYVIKRPSRQQSDDATIYRASKESELIKKGVISAALLEKRISNDGGALTEAEQKEKQDLLEKFNKLNTEFTELNEIKEEEKTKEQKARSGELLKDLGEIVNRLQELNNVSDSLYNRTAEFLAMGDTARYLTLMLSYEDKGGKLIPVFGEGDYEKKLKVYDEMEEKEDDYTYALIKKLLFLTNMYYMGRATTKQEFDTLLSLYDNQNLLGNL